MWTKWDMFLKWLIEPGDFGKDIGKNIGKISVHK